MIAKQTDICGCKYSCALTINSTSMKYNGGTFLTKLSVLGHMHIYNATFAITHILVKPRNSSDSHKSLSLHSIYFIIGSGAGIIVVIFLTVGVLCSLKECGFISRKKHSGIMLSVDHPTSRK